MKIVKERRLEGSLGLGLKQLGRWGRLELGRRFLGNVLVARYQTERLVDYNGFRARGRGQAGE